MLETMFETERLSVGTSKDLIKCTKKLKHFKNRKASNNLQEAILNPRGAGLEHLRSDVRHKEIE